MRDEYLEGEFLRGPLLLEKNRINKFDPRIRVQNSGVQNSAPNSGFGGAKSPAQKFVPEKLQKRNAKGQIVPTSRGHTPPLPHASDSFCLPSPAPSSKRITLTHLKLSPMGKK